MKTVLLGSVLAVALIITSCLDEERTESLLDSGIQNDEDYIMLRGNSRNGLK